MDSFAFHHHHEYKREPGSYDVRQGSVERDLNPLAGMNHENAAVRINTEGIVRDAYEMMKAHGGHNGIGVLCGPCQKKQDVQVTPKLSQVIGRQNDRLKRSGVRPAHRSDNLGGLGCQIFAGGNIRWIDDSYYDVSLLRERLEKAKRSHGRLEIVDRCLVKSICSRHDPK